MPESDVQTIMQEVRDWIRNGSDSGQWQPSHSLLSAEQWPDIRSLNRAIQTLELRKTLVGQLPPAPPTFRGRLGAVLVKAIRRSLFWFTSRLDDFHTDVVEGFEVQFGALRNLMAAREKADQILRAEAGERRALSFAVAENARALQELKDLYGSREGTPNRETRASRLRGVRAEFTRRRSVIAGPTGLKARLRERRWEVGICGTFAVANYGDLLSPLIAEAELSRRLGAVTLHCFSHHAKRPPFWPYEVISLTKLPEMIRQLDGLLIGGDLLIRFDKNLAPGYAPPGLSTLCASGIHHPTGDWLTPALMALQHDVPVAWNAPGMYCDEVPDWAKPLMERALTLSAYRTVRDELSRNVLEPLTTALIDVVPDTAFGLSRLLDFQGAPTTQFTQFAEAYQLKSPYLVFQHCSGFEGVHRLIRNHPERFGRFRFLMLPISPEFGQHSESIECDLPGVIRLAEWPNPLLTAELIGRAEAVLGHSYRLSITALAAGVPVFRRVDLSAGKFTALQHFESIFILPDGTLDLEWFLAHIGRTTPSAAAGATLGPLSAHWDRIAAMVREKAAPTAPMLDRFWQSLPGLLENAGARLT